MLETGAAMFLLIPNPDNARILHAGKVIESSREGFVAEFEQSIAPPVGSDVNAYAETRGKFFQQGAVVVEIRQALPRSVIVFSRAGEPVSAEQRQLYRVCVVTSDIFARIGDERNCSVVDVSPAGFAALTTKEHRIGSLLQVSLRAEEHAFSAKARLQTIKNTPDGRFRCGFLVPQSNAAARKTLQQLSTAAQRRQLRRLAGVA
jgi:hypothetical protein